MARLPLPGSDDGQWGDLLNDYLLQAHEPTGGLKTSVVGAPQLKPQSVTAAALADGTIPESKLATAVQVKLNAATGPVGPAGPIGPMGPVGPAGADSTVAGPQGIQGVKGDTGTQGIQGPKGNQGDPGSDGADSIVPGPQGVQGDKGDQGDPGTPGIQGIQGIPGPKGDTGDTGATGAPGTTTWAGITDKPTEFTPTAHTHTTTQISDSTVTGRSLLTAADATTARTAIGAGTGSSNLVIGVTAGTAKAGDYTPTKSDVGLGSVDNTADVDKPVSTAQLAAIGAKYSKPGAGVPEADLDAAVRAKLNSSAPFIVVENISDVPPGTVVGTVIVVTG